MSRQTAVSATVGAFCILTAAVVSPARADELFIGWTYGDESHIVWYDTETSSSNTTLVGNQQGYMRDINVDPVGRMYWAAHPTILASYVHSANRNGSDVQTVISQGGGDWIGSVALDKTHGYLYYSGAVKLPDQYYGVVRTDLDGSNPLVITDTNWDRPVYDVAVDESAGKVYMAYDNETMLRCNLDGSGLETVLTDLNHVRHIELDPARGLMYLIEVPEITVAPMDGSAAPQTVLSGMDPQCLSLAPGGNTIYFGNDDDNYIYRMNRDGTGVTAITRVYEPVALDVIPEPASAALFCAALTFLYRRRKNT